MMGLTGSAPGLRVVHERGVLGHGGRERVEGLMAAGAPRLLAGHLFQGQAHLGRWRGFMFQELDELLREGLFSETKKSK